MSDPSTPPAELPDLLDVQRPSAIERQHAALRDAGVAPADVAATRAAVAALGVSEPSAPSASLRDRLMATAKRTGRYGIFADRLGRMFDLSIDDATALARKIEDPAEWKPFIVPGVEMIPVTAGPACDGAIATMVRLQPGAQFPDHVHHGTEEMFVLDGGFVEPSGTKEEAWRGDVMLRDDGTEHALLALEGVPCVAAVIIFGHADFR